MFDLIIKINNFLIRKLIKKVNPEDTVILGARCLQSSDCNKKITNDINECIKCGKCTIKDIVELKEEYNIPNACIATGGTLARRFVREHKPKLVFAIACKRELALGILGILPYKSFGFVLEQPCGPCKDTVFDRDGFRKVLESFVTI